MPTPLLANFIVETPQTELAVVGIGLELPNGQQSFLSCSRSGRSREAKLYVATPRPFIYGKPVLVAEVDTEYRYQASAIRSLGHLTAREPLAMNFWDIEEPIFSLEQAPDWLKIDAATGLLSGTPDAAGESKVIVRVTIERCENWTRTLSVEEEKKSLPLSPIESAMLLRSLLFVADNPV